MPYTNIPFLHCKNQTSWYSLPPPLWMLNQTETFSFHILKFQVKNLPVSCLYYVHENNIKMAQFPANLIHKSSNQNLPMLVIKQPIQHNTWVRISSKSLPQLMFQQNTDRIWVTYFFVKIYSQLIYYTTHNSLILHGFRSVLQPGGAYQWKDGIIYIISVTLVLQNFKNKNFLIHFQCK